MKAKADPVAPSSEVTADLLRRPWALSQRRLLTEQKFLDELKRRGQFVTEGHLEALHREGVLIPWLRVDRDIAAVLREFRHKDPSPWRWELASSSPPMTASALLDEWVAGRVADGAVAPFSRWKRRLRRRGEMSVRAWDYLYSPYQLLLVPEMRETIDLLGRNHPSAWSAGRMPALRRAALQSRTVIPLLTELEFVYYSSVRRMSSIPIDAQREFDDAWAAFDAVEVLARTRWTADALLKQAEYWLWKAHSRDPLRNWMDLVGLIAPDRWERLEGEALMAIDFRIAAEMILRFIEDLARVGAALPVPDYSSSRMFHPLNDRLGRGHKRLEQTLTTYGISPHPALVLVVEGSSEMYVIGEMLEYFGIPRLDSYIRLTLLGGVEKEIELLARFLAPALGPVEGDLAQMERPPTRIMVVVDAESRKYRTSGQRQRSKGELVRHLYNALAEEHQTPTTLQDLAFLVDIETWGPTVRNLEFAHFTDHALAKAIMATGKVPNAETLQLITARVAGIRTGGGSLKRIWKSWPDPKPDKVEMWHHLWPVLRKRIRRAEKTQTEEHIPLVRVLRAAERKARGPRSHTVLRVRP